ncbi:pre-mRNA-splicing factor syf2 [Cryomyces antarcticus]|uniref:Pre-mRNA-splicing factor SYF2 n=1 Tax=Cryomyces antarcticus TaxID=329879 RepID=A0ABR0KTH3_9PEZI|nr:Pre-mRNA-splicing factor SYF2 [Cryomyces antarcticus]KAK5017144.1 Pre-mRNA-splicing factor SYF2 [Cryomyces antarcticus]KAK5129632.1 Pre-mRNA-splicing factor SYF2 [Cryomyces antarcticus]
MKTSHKRKTSPSAEDVSQEPAKRRFAETTSAEEPQAELITHSRSESPPATPSGPQSSSDSAASKVRERKNRFAALRARQSQSRKQNLKEVTTETQRLAVDPNLLSNLSRKHAIASHKLLKADTAAAGEDFERKRAWDWTVEEAEAWDKRLAKKAGHKDDVAFQDYRQDARKAYKRQMREFKPDIDAYEQSKRELVDKAAARGGLEIVETEAGELIAVDRDGSFYSTSQSTDFTGNRPDKAAVDRLVEDIRKAEEARLKKRKERGRNDDDGDVTFINDKNKQFNQKLARFYNKYTADIRDSFERGTAI